MSSQDVWATYLRANLEALILTMDELVLAGT